MGKGEGNGGFGKGMQDAGKPRYKPGPPRCLTWASATEDPRGTPTSREVSVTCADGQHSPGVAEVRPGPGTALSVDPTPDTKGEGPVRLSLLPSGGSCTPGAPRHSGNRLTTSSPHGELRAPISSPSTPSPLLPKNKASTST